jgi:hypothetical protein
LSSVRCLSPDLELLKLRNHRLGSLELRELPLDFVDFGGVLGLGRGEAQDIGGKIIDVFMILQFHISPNPPI